MRPGDEGKPMSIFEYISDEPLEAEAYVDYLIENHRAHAAYWHGLPNTHDGPTARECVLAKMSMFITNLEDIKRKMHRPAA